MGRSTYEYADADGQGPKIEFDDGREYSFKKDYGFGSNWFINPQLGYSLSLGENCHPEDFIKAYAPSIDVMFGKWFVPSFGMRLDVGMNPMVGRAPKVLIKQWPELYGTYRYNVFSMYLDGMANVSNIIKPFDEKKVFNLIGIFGAGFIQTFAFEKKLKDWHLLYPVNTKGATYMAAHVGVQCLWRTKEHLDWVAEAKISATDDKFNGVKSGLNVEFYTDFKFGIVYHFADKNGNRRFHNTIYRKKLTVGEPKPILATAAERVADAEDPAIQFTEKVSIGDTLNTRIRFYIDRTYIHDDERTKVASVARFMMNNPNLTLRIVGMPDVNSTDATNDSHNRKIALSRAQAVRDMLIVDFGIPANRLIVDHTLRPARQYEEVNEWIQGVVFIMQ